MESVTFGTGRRRNFIRSGKLMTMSVFQHCGILTNHLNLRLLVGMEKSSTGIKNPTSICKYMFKAKNIQFRLKIFYDFIFEELQSR